MAEYVLAKTSANSMTTLIPDNRIPHFFGLSFYPFSNISNFYSLTNLRNRL
ncbi:hypothetical protein AB6735_20345 [Mucilaginibacter sp. RCC_168]|uniref:hypothetical protein n=1 Tax=Mucilaginibacter sp. RCC_168 TaxID=3239221 RepID=UPI0035261038